MGILKLIIADYDAEYVTSLERFLMIYYPQRFDIISFLSTDKLCQYLNKNEKSDILLINKLIWKEEVCLKNAGCMITFSEDDCKPLPQSKGSIKKFQSAEKIVSDILRIYVSSCIKAASIKEGGNTRIISVCSPMGGSGKSSVAAGLSILSAGRGLKTFYLNMEDMPCSESFFSGDSEQCFSNIIFHLKGKELNPGIVLEGAKCRDSKTGVYFYRPPDNALEMQELAQNDITRLLDAFRLNSFFDIVFVDMPCGMDKRCTTLLGGSDMILSIMLPGKNSSIKNKKFLESISVLKSKYGIDLLNKLITVRNRQKNVNENAYENACNNSFPDTGGLTFDIGEYSPKLVDDHDSELIKNVEFLTELNKILDAVINCTCTQLPLTGGMSNA